MSDMLVSEQQEEHHIETFDFSTPESVIIRVFKDPLGGYGIPTWKGYSIEDATIIKCCDRVTGAVGYEMSYGGFIDQTIMNMTDCPGEGWFVVEDITGEYHHGDGWTTDDDMTFDYKRIRPATQEEQGLA